MTATEEGNASTLKCYVCGRTDKDAPIFPVRFRGEDKWVCAKCLPRLIHG